MIMEREAAGAPGAHSYFYKWRTPEAVARKITKAREKGEITEEEEGLLVEYLAEYAAAQHPSLIRQGKVINHILVMRRVMGRPFPEMTAGDMYRAINALHTATSIKGTVYAQNTRRDLVMIFKMFLKWLLEEGYISVPAAKIDKIKSVPKKQDTTSPDEILTEEEIQAILTSCKTSRDRAFISVLYESGMRIGELSQLKWNHIKFDINGMSIYIPDTKTNKTRYVRLYMALPYLAAWRADYPGGSPAGEAPVFLTLKGASFTWETATKIVSRIATRAGLQKRVHPHLFRKSRITHMVTQGYQESVIRSMMWGNQNTQQLKTYIVLSEADIDAETAARAGVKLKRKTNKSMEPRICQACGEINGPIDLYCRACGRGLTEEVRMSVNEAEAWIEQSGIVDEIRQMVREKLGLETGDCSG